MDDASVPPVAPSMGVRGVGGVPDPGGGGRWILHVDMDAFFASVEVLDHPELAGKAVIVGGTGARGVVAACTYEARRFGVHSAMPSALARRLCPQAIFLEGRFRRYVEVSSQLHAILEGFTPLVEGISLDEAFLDVTGSVGLLGPAPTVAIRIRRQVSESLGLDCSVGVGRTKLVAKLASKAAKPSADRTGVRPGPGVVVVPSDREAAFLGPLPVQALWGVGPATAKRLDDLGVATVGELAALPRELLVRRLGRAHGSRLAELARGEDDRPVVPAHDPKSVGHEETFPVDLVDGAALRRHLARLADASASQLRRVRLGARTVTVKVRFSDFSTITRSQTVAVPLDSFRAVDALAAALLASVDCSRGVRLLGVSLSGLGPVLSGTQLAFPLDADAGVGGGAPPRDDGVSGDGGPPGGSGPAGDSERLQAAWAEVTAAIDGIRERYGRDAVGNLSLLTPEGLQGKARGEAQWGPSRDDDRAGRERPRGVPRG